MSSSEPLADHISNETPAFVDRLVYVVGSARGGTSLVMMLLNAHPQMIGFPGPTSFMLNVWRYRRRVHRRLLRLIWSCPGFLKLDGLRDVLGPERFRSLEMRIARAFVRLSLKPLYGLYPMIEALTRAPDRPASDWSGWIDKANDAGGLPEIARAFPHARFVFIARDPRGAVASLVVREQLADGAQTDRDARWDQLVSNTLYWRRLMTRCAAQFRRDPARCLFVRFEDMLDAPESLAQDLYAFAFDDPPAADEVAKIIAATPYSASNDPEERGTGVRSAPKQRWRSALSEAEQACIRNLAGAVAAHIGYGDIRADWRPALWTIMRLPIPFRRRVFLSAKWAAIFVEGGAARLRPSTRSAAA